MFASLRRVFVMNSLHLGCKVGHSSRGKNVKVSNGQEIFSLLHSISNQLLSETIRLITASMI